jgi:hypothetical protein
VFIPMDSGHTTDWACKFLSHNTIQHNRSFSLAP